MSASNPFSGPATRSDMLLVAKLALAQIYGDLGAASAALLSISGGSVYAYYPCAGILPNIIVGRNLAGLNVVSVQGTSTGWQWVGNLLGQGLTPSFSGSGFVSLWFQSFALAAYYRVKNAISNGFPTVFVGHSLGGGAAILMGNYAANDGINVRGAYILGSPKVGDASFEAGLPFPVFSWYTSDDLVGSLPPSSVIQWIAPWPYTVLTGAADYVPSGSQRTIWPDGSLTDGYAQWDVPSIITGLLFSAAGTHEASYYVSFLRRQFGNSGELLPGANGYLNPWILADMAGPPSPAGSSGAGAKPAPYGWLSPVSVNTVDCSGVVNATPTLIFPPSPSTLRGRYGPPVPVPSVCC